jgi:hypothetical protein
MKITQYFVAIWSSLDCWQRVLVTSIGSATSIGLLGFGIVKTCDSAPLIGIPSVLVGFVGFITCMVFLVNEM